MKFINSNTSRFPYPVLHEGYNDYINGKLEYSIRLKENDGKKDRMHIFETNVLLDQPYLEKLLDEKKITMKLCIDCRWTLKRIEKDVQVGEDSITLDIFDIKNTADTRIVLYCTEEIIHFRDDDFHSDYGEQSFSLRKGDIIGFSENQQLKLDIPNKILNSKMFEIRPREDIDENSFSVDLSEENIIIIAGEKIYKKINERRNDPSRWDENKCGIYLPALLHILKEMTTDQEIWTDKEWFKVLSEMIEREGRDYKNMDSDGCFLIAQKMLRFPYMTLDEENKENE